MMKRDKAGLCVIGAVVCATTVSGPAAAWAAAAPAEHRDLASVAVATEGFSPDAEAVARLIAQVAPDRGYVVPTQTSGSVSADPSEAIVVTGGDGSALGVQLPPEAPVAPAMSASDHTAVYEGVGEAGAVDVAVQSLSSGAVRIQTVLEGPTSPRTFTYALEGGFQAVEAPDGSIWAAGFSESGELRVFGVDDAWARDANGRPVDTHYDVVDNALVQVVTPDESAVFPVVADPTWQWYAAAYGAGFSKSETRGLASAGGVTGFCALLPGPLAVVCGVAGAQWFLQAGLAANANGCVFLAAVPAPIAMRWDSPECK